MASELGRLTAVTWLAFRGSLQGFRLAGLAALAVAPALIVLALVSAHPAASTLADSAEDLYSLLTLPIVTMLIVLVLSVGQFRNEIDSETLLYLSDRSVARPTIVVGKYLGALGASLVLVVPATLLPLAVATLGGGTPYAANVPVVLTLAIVLAAMAYAGFFLFLGLVTRSALLVGLLFGFVWEEILRLLPGEVPRLTVVYYLHAFLSWALTTGPLSGFPTVVPLALVVATPILVAVAFVATAAMIFRYLETAPERETA